jgi:hypothetical protein
MCTGTRKCFFILGRNAHINYITKYLHINKLYIINLLLKYLHVVSLNGDTGGSSQHLQMPQQRVRSEQHTATAIAARFAVIVSAAASAAEGLDDHLVNAAGGRAQGFLHILEFGVQAAPRLHPQFLYPVLEYIARIQNILMQFFESIITDTEQGFVKPLKLHEGKPGSSIADPHHFDAVPDPDSACHFDADPDPTFHFDENPDPELSFQIKAETTGNLLAGC